MSLSAEFKLVQRSNLEAILFSVFTLDFLKDNSGCVQRVIVDAMRFRPNLVISGAEPYAEDDWKSLHIGKARFTVSFQNPYYRFQMYYSTTKCARMWLAQLI